MSTAPVVRAFYDRIWNGGDLEAAWVLLKPDFQFRGSLGPELRGIPPFLEYKPNTFSHNRGAKGATLRWCSGSSRNAVRLPPSERAFSFAGTPKQQGVDAELKRYTP
jgi:hypothetical protein